MTQTGLTTDFLSQILSQIQPSEQELKIQKNYEEAMEVIPESFIPVNMLYLDVHINSHHLKAFIDTGAQVSIMSEFIAETCGFHKLIDRQYHGMAKGVGQAEITGRIHCVDVFVGTKVLPCSFTILNTIDLKLIIGLDMLLSHGCLLDLKRRCLILNDERIDFVKGDHHLTE